MSESTSQSTTKTLFNGCGLFIACIIGTIASGVTANIGVGIGGFKDGSLGLGSLYFGFWGLVAGVILTISAVIYAKVKYQNEQENIYAFTLFAVPMVVLIGSAILFPIASTIGGYQSRKKTEYREASQKKQDLLYEQIKENPEIAIQENWSSVDYEHALVFESSWYDENVPYSIDQLKRIYADNPKAYQVFLHPAATPQFIASHFDDAFKENRNALDYIVRNPKTPIHLIRRVANSSPTMIYPPVHIRARKIIQDYDQHQNEKP